MNIGLLWHNFFSANLGVGALSYAHIHLIDRVVKEAGLSAAYRVIGGRTDLPFEPRRLALDAPVELVRAKVSRDLLGSHSVFEKSLDGLDIVFDLSEGDSFADIYGWRRFMYQLLTKRRVTQRKIPLVLSPQTIGPFNHSISSALAKYQLKRSRQIFARDDISFQWLERRKLAHLSEKTIDVAFGLRYDRPDEAAAGERRPRVGFNVSGLLYRNGYTGKNEFELVADYREVVHGALRQLSELDCDVRVVGHVLDERADAVEDDYRVCSALADEYEAVTLAPRFGDPMEAKGYIAGLDFFVGSRMHATIAAFSAGVPVVPVAYSRKFNGLFGTLDYPYLADLRAEDAGSVIGKILEYYAKRAELKLRVDAGNRRAASMLGAYEASVREILRSVAR